MNKKWAFFFSGQGTNLNALLNKYHKQWVHPPVLITNNPQAKGIQVGLNYGLSSKVLDLPIDYKELSLYLKQNEVECLFLLGFLKIIPQTFITDWPQQIFNLHPSLLPKYPGLNSIQRAYEKKDVIGVSIHQVTQDVDDGQILSQDLVFSGRDYDHLSLDEVQRVVHSKEHNMVCDFIPLGEQIGSKL